MTIDMSEVLMTTIDINDSFWAHVQVRGPDDPDACWRYDPDRGSRGRYGHVRITTHDGRRVYAHREAFRLSGGTLERGQLCCHTCDVGDCANPRHLYAGTLQSNVRDREERNRRTPNLPRGSASWSAKFSEREVEAVREARSHGVPARTLAAMFRVSTATIYNLWKGVYYSGDGFLSEPSPGSA